MVRPIDWLPEELAWIEARKDWPRALLHRAFVWFFGRNEVSETALKGLCKRKGWLTGRTGYTPGHVPANKGKKGLPAHPNSARTQFKKGARPANRREVGYESIDRDGYLKICVAEPNPYTGAQTRMAFKHRWLWEKANGPVPAGHRLKCLDGDKTNCDPSNWEAIPDGLAPHLNGIRGRAYDQAPAELKPVIMSTAKLAHRVSEMKRGRNHA